MKWQCPVTISGNSVGRNDVTYSDTWFVTCGCSMLLLRVKDCLWSEWWSKQNQSLQQNYTLKYLHCKICNQQWYPATVSPENFTILDQKHWNMTNFSALYRHSMISFSLVRRSVCAKFNNCNRHNSSRTVLFFPTSPFLHRFMWLTPHLEGNHNCLSDTSCWKQRNL